MKNKILVIACLVLVLCVSLVLPMATAFADYTEDILNNPQAIVNFNQIFDFSSIADNTAYAKSSELGTTNIITTESFELYTGVKLNLISGHKYYFYVDSNCDAFIEIYNPTVSYARNINVIGIFTFDTTHDNYRVFFRRWNTGTTGYLRFYVIDLTQMLGSNNDNITLQQSKDLFVANYYAYNTGTSMSFGGLDSYVRGFNDALGSVEVALDTTLLESNIFVTEGLVDTNVQGGNYDWNISGANAEFGFYLPNNILLGDVVTISFNKIANRYPTINGSAITNFQVGYYSNGSFIVVATCNFSDLTIESSSDNIGIYSIVYSAYTFSFTSNTTINALYFKLPSNNSDLLFDDLNLKVVTSNPYYAIQSSFQSGYKKSEDYYKDLYKVGGSAYQAIYNKGYYDYPSDDHFTFKSLITSAVDVPVQAFTNLFDFDILGVNMKTFYLSVFTLCVIFVVLRLVL